MKRVENKYIVNTDDKVVVCYRKSVNESFIMDEVNRKCPIEISELIFEMCGTWLDHIPEVEIGSEYKGVAKCDSRDTFDEKTGRDVSRLIATKKYHDAASRKYYKLAKYFEKAMKEMETLAIEHNNDYVETCCKLKEYEN